MERLINSFDNNKKYFRAVDFKYAKVMDHSAIEAINSMSEKYREQGKEMTLIRLDKDSYRLFQDARTITNVEIIEDTVIENEYRHTLSNYDKEIEERYRKYKHNTNPGQKNLKKDLVLED